MDAYIEEAFVEARAAYTVGEVPVGCVFVYNGEIIARGGNYVNKTKNATRHAEWVCIDQTLKYCSLKQLESANVFPNISVYVTVEPCIMCASALCNLQVKDVFYGCVNDRFGGQTILNASELLKHKMQFIGGYREEEAMDLLKEFYKGANPAAPISKVNKNKD